MTLRIVTEVRGIADINDILRDLAPNEASNLMRATVYDIAKTAAKRMSDYTPDDPSTGTGDLKSSIKPKRERSTRAQANASVVVTNTRRNYFWRFLEYGQGPDHVEYAMGLKALQSMRPEIDHIYAQAFVKKLLARLARARKK
jgi:Bacteriophage HK97-gp10, putative tail-component